MIQINIIPKDLKREIRLKKTYIDVKKAVFFVSIFGVFYIAAIVGGKIILDSHYRDIMSRTSIVSKDTEKYSNSAKEINDEINEISKIQSENVSWVEFLSVLSNMIGEDVTLSSLTVSNKHDLSMKGVSASRESMLAFKAELEKSGHFSEINLPLKNLLEKNNINFELTAKITNYDFSQDKK